MLQHHALRHLVWQFHRSRSRLMLRFRELATLMFVVGCLAAAVGHFIVNHRSKRHATDEEPSSDAVPAG
jgi:hypothetical protein